MAHRAVGVSLALAGLALLLFGWISGANSVNLASNPNQTLAEGAVLAGVGFLVLLFGGFFEKGRKGD